MTTILFAVAVFLLAVLTHLLICRNSSDKSLKGKLFIQISIGYLLIFSFFNAIFLAPYLFTAIIIYLLLIPSFLVAYVTTELLSPSKKIMQLLDGQALSEEQVIIGLKKENLILSRLDELEQSKCVTNQQGRYVLTPTGHYLALFLKIYGKTIGRGMGG